MKPLASKPGWLKKKISVRELSEIQGIMKRNRLHTICEEARCPNISECYRRREATFLIMGNACTRRCSFCNVAKGAPLPLDAGEPSRVAGAVREMGLRHAVITSPTRDDLPDGGASHFAMTVQAVKEANPGATVELLIPDFLGKEEDVRTAAFSGAEIVGHNMETVRRLYAIRKGADYGRSLRVLKRLSALNPNVLTKTGLMLGLGETGDEIARTLEDLLEANCGLLTLGQYLSPGSNHHPVVEFVPPETFDTLKERALRMGFRHVESGPYVRSSYHASDVLHGVSVDHHDAR